MGGTSPSFPTAAAAARSGSSMSKPAESGNWQPQAPLGFRRGRAGSGEPPSFLTHDLGVMMRAPSLLMLFAASAFAVACGGKAAPETPAPEATPAPATPAPAPVDDSADRDRLERERIAREAAERARAVANPGVKIKISGHADERGSDEYNLALGNRRAAAAKRYLEGKGVDGSRIEVVSYGEERPLNPGSDESAYAQNRRDEFEVTAGGDNLSAPQ
jgi:peptidoglycan-associated lipoprotein